MTNEDLDLMIDVLALNLITEEVKFETLNISITRMENLIKKFKSNKVVMENSHELSSEFASIIVNRILDRNNV